MLFSKKLPRGRKDTTTSLFVLFDDSKGACEHCDQDIQTQHRWRWTVTDKNDNYGSQETAGDHGGGRDRNYDVL
jgi:hypothetical protein